MQAIKETFRKKFVFGPGTETNGFISLTNKSLYCPEAGYGFVTESVKEKYESMRIPELGNAFDIDQSMAGQEITDILMETVEDGGDLKKSCCYVEKEDVPLYFKVNVPRTGNYNVSLVIGGRAENSSATVFSERRRCVLRNASVKNGEAIQLRFTANVCDIVPRGKEEVYHDDSLDITIVGRNVCLCEVIVEEVVNTKTIYIAGDSTVTDQGAQYPYNPMSSYCGWGQMLPLFIKENMAVSNHAHSGLTTESFRTGGHWDIVERSIRPGDFFFMQFGHNDQKDKKLSAFEGYAENLRRYVDEVRAKGAFPIIITPVSRTLWNAPGGEFNDLLADNAEACKMVAREKNVPLIDLHKKSIEFILKFGAKDSTKFFYPKDYTHHNDYGGFEMAKLVIQEIKEADIKDIVKYLRDIPVDSIELPEELCERQGGRNYTPVQPINYVQLSAYINFVDIENHWAKTYIEEIVKKGIMKGKEENFFPEDSVSRAEFLSILLTAFRLLPKNVYNDVYSDVFGDEWYAGTVQSGYDNELIDSSITPNNNFQPEQPITCEDAASMTLKAYKNKFGEEPGSIFETGENNLYPKECITRAQAAFILKRALDKFVS